MLMSVSMICVIVWHAEIMLNPKTSYLSVYLTNFTRRLLQVINIEFFSTHYFTCCSEGAQGAIGMFVFKHKTGFLLCFSTKWIRHECVFYITLANPLVLEMYWNLLVLTISKHPLRVQFDQVLAEIFDVRDTRYHSFIFMRIDLRRWKKQKSEQFDPKIVLFQLQRY